MTLRFDLAGGQIDGSRDYQEDAFLITHLTDADGNPSSLVIVADGMGGHAAGNVASNMAVQAFNKHVSANYPAQNPSSILHECVLKANDSIRETVKETPALAGMGCTMVAAILEGGRVWWASVGDSHLYLIRNKELIKKNADHSYGGYLDRMAAAGTPVEPEKGLSRNMLMSALTGDEINEIDTPSDPLELEAGDRILLCSDGMDTLSDGKIIQFSEWSDSPKECVEALMQAVEEAAMPKQDNTTAVVVNVRAEEAAAVPVPTPASEPVEEINLDQTFDEAVEMEPEAVTEPSVTQPAAQEEKKKGSMGLILGIAAVLVIAAVGAYLFLGSGKQEPAGSGTGTPVELSATEPEAEPTAEPGAETTAPAPAVPEVAAQSTAVTTPSPVTATTPAPAPASTGASQTKKEFQDQLKDGSPGPIMVVIPAGTYDMGSPGTSRNADERPRHEVRIKSFAFSKYEITFEEYNKFAVATNRKSFKAGEDTLYMEPESHPVIFVSWDDAYYFAKWLSEQTGKNYRLPSEAEWEYAAGTGVRSPFWWGFNEEPGHGHCVGCGTGLDPRKPTKIGSFDPNKFGIYDTTGNVAEWVRDCWHPNYDGAPATGELWEGGDCAYRVVRGGAYSSPFQSVRHTKRDKFKSDQEYDFIGIRLARDLD